jgi:hypothetical protein
MILEYKADWPEAKERYREWWSGEYFGRCGLFVTGLREGVEDVSPPVASEAPECRWTDRLLVDVVERPGVGDYRGRFGDADATLWPPGRYSERDGGAISWRFEFDSAGSPLGKY